MEVLNELNLNTPVYIYMRLRHVIGLIQNHTLSIPRVNKWEDTYENWFIKEDFRLVDGTKITATNLIPCVYGQCWTKLKESDAMWRIYSTVKKSESDKTNSFEYLQESSIKIRTTAQKIYNAVPPSFRDKTYIGNVNYLSQQEFDNHVARLDIKSRTNLERALIESYFIKRKEFTHEEEIRTTIIFDPSDSEIQNNFIYWSINPNDIIEELVADPRLNDEEYQYVHDQLVKAKARPECISQSELYKFNRATIQIKF